MAIIFTSSKSKKKQPKTAAQKQQAAAWDKLCDKWKPSKIEVRSKDLGESSAYKKMQQALSSRNPYDLPSKGTDGSFGGNVPLPKKYSGDLANREAEAQKEIEAKKKRVAILYNKGGIQYITDGMDPKTFGRK